MSDVICWVFVSSYKPSPCQVSLHLELEIRFFIFDETNYNHVLKESYNFVHGDPIP